MITVANFGRLLVVAGSGMMLLGLVVWLVPRRSGQGRLPGDFVLRRGDVTLHFPLATSLLVSLALSLLVNLLWRR